MLGDPRQGAVRTPDTLGLPPSMVDAIADAGGLWYAGDYYARPDVIVATAREHRVRALRVDARELSWIAELPDIEFLHVRTDGRPVLDPIRELRRLRALTIDVGAVRGTLDLEAHPDLRWLKIRLSGKGGEANRPAILAGHPLVEHLRLNEIPFGDLTELAAAFPSVRFFGTYGADRLKALGDIGPWRNTLRAFSAEFALRLRTLGGLEMMDRLEYVGMTYGALDEIDPLRRVRSLRFLELAARFPSLVPLTGHSALSMALLTMPADEDLEPLRTLPSLVLLGGEQWIGRPIAGVPLMEDLAQDHPLRNEWRRAVGG